MTTKPLIPFASCPSAAFAKAHSTEYSLDLTAAAQAAAPAGEVVRVALYGMDSMLLMLAGQREAAIPVPEGVDPAPVVRRAVLALGENYRFTVVALPGRIEVREDYDYRREFVPSDYRDEDAIRQEATERARMALDWHRHDDFAQVRGDIEADLRLEAAVQAMNRELHPLCFAAAVDLGREEIYFYGLGGVPYFFDELPDEAQAIVQRHQPQAANDASASAAA